MSTTERVMNVVTVVVVMTMFSLMTYNLITHGVSQDELYLMH